jgi:cytoskeletal protein CcmA (bactofilin family)
MSYFSQSKTGDKQVATTVKPRQESGPAQTSAFARGMVITGNIVCTDPVEIFDRVTGDIHASQLTICEGAQVEGKVIAQDAIIQNTFKGTVHGNTVKLRGTAVVDGEIFNRSLTIEQDARFEGVARRLDQPVEAPRQVEMPTQGADVVPISGAA